MMFGWTSSCRIAALELLSGLAKTSAAAATLQIARLLNPACLRIGTHLLFRNTGTQDRNDGTRRNPGEP
jgi:hypothetical protein